jgi:hypothetical protein
MVLVRWKQCSCRCLRRYKHVWSFTPVAHAMQAAINLFLGNFGVLCVKSLCSESLHNGCCIYNGLVITVLLTVCLLQFHKRGARLCGNWTPMLICTIPQASLVSPLSASIHGAVASLHCTQGVVPGIWGFTDMARANVTGTSLKRGGSSSGSLSRAGSADLPHSAGNSEDGSKPVQSGNLWRLPGAPKPSPLGAVDGLSRRCR